MPPAPAPTTRNPWLDCPRLSPVRGDQALVDEAVGQQPSSDHLIPDADRREATGQVKDARRGSGRPSASGLRGAAVCALPWLTEAAHAFLERLRTKPRWRLTKHRVGVRGFRTKRLTGSRGLLGLARRREAAQIHLAHDPYISSELFAWNCRWRVVETTTILNEAARVDGRRILKRRRLELNECGRGA